MRALGDTGILVSPVALGCWPMSGVTTKHATRADSLATLAECLDLGINFLDTAYCYGHDGESERMIGEAIGSRRDEVVIATKGGIHWNAERKQTVDGRPDTLIRECDESLRRLATDRVELYYLHAPDPLVPLAESAGALGRLLEAGKVRSVGLSNATLADIQAFHAVCPLTAFQPPYNMLQRGIEADTLPWCVANNVAVNVYWPLMKGLLTGKCSRDHQFAPGDGRVKYPMFQSPEWEKNQDFLDALRAVAADAEKTVAQVAINWTIHQPGITAALCGAIRPEQSRDNAGAMHWQLTAEQQARIADALARRGQPLTRGAV